MIDEFDLIATIVDALGDATAGESVVLGPGDDAAVLRLPPAHELVVSTDTLVAGRHYPADAAAELVGYRSLAVSVSDLAAMGARPVAAVVSLTAQRLTKDWARAFARGIAEAARAFRTPIVGGNLARGDANICVAVHGSLPQGESLTRAGASAGDDLYVTGQIGGAGLALSAGLLKGQSLSEVEPRSAQARYWLPQPRLAIGQRLRGVASAAIDISDGLASDVVHICEASGIGCDIDLGDVPAFPGSDPATAVCSGDDYELAFTAAPTHADVIGAIARETDTPIHRIGNMNAKPGARWRRKGKPVAVAGGFRHF